MTFRSTILAVLAAFAVSPAFAQGSERHSAEAVDHSGQAASHGSASAASGAAVVSSVPIIAFGSSVAISGAALEEIGEGALELGSELNRAGSGEPVRPAPDGPPVLD